MSGLTLSKTSFCDAHSPNIPSKLKLLGSSTLFAEVGVTGRLEEEEGVDRDGVDAAREEDEGVELDKRGVKGAGDALVLLEREDESGVLVLTGVDTMVGVEGGVSTSMVERQFFRSEEMD